MMQTNFSPRNISANKVERVVPNALQDFRCGPSVLRASRSTFHCIDGLGPQKPVIFTPRSLRPPRFNGVFPDEIHSPVG